MVSQCKKKSDSVLFAKPEENNMSLPEGVKHNDGLISNWIRARLFNATFNNNSNILWQTVLLVKGTEVPREKQQIWHKSLTSFIT